MSIAVEIIEPKTVIDVTTDAETAVTVAGESVVQVTVGNSEEELTLTLAETSTPVAITTEPPVVVDILTPSVIHVEVTAAADGMPGAKGDPGTTTWAGITDKPTIPTALSELTDDASHRLTTDTEKSGWDGKEPAISAGAQTQFWQGDKSWFTPSTFGRNWLALINPLSGRTTLELGSAALNDSADFATAAQGLLAGTAVQPAGLATALADYQGKDIDLTALSGIGSVAYGRSLLTLANADAGRTTFGLGSAAVLDVGVAGGLVPLDLGGKIAEAYLPDSVLGQVEYQGLWNASTDTPTLPAAGSANRGWYYIASADGTWISIDFKTGDWVISNGSTWAKVDNTDAISSFSGRVGAITPAVGDYSAFYQPLNAGLTALAALTTTSFGRGLLLETSAPSLKTTLGLAAIENTALSTWAGSANLTTLGAVGAGTWNATAIGKNKIKVFTSSVCTSNADGLLSSHLSAGHSFLGVSDQTSQLQALFDLAQTEPIIIVWDGAYSTTGLKIYPNTKIFAVPGCGAVLRSYGTGSSSYLPIFRNANPSASTILDSNITIEGGIWNGNSENQPYYTIAQGWSSAFRFIGVSDITLRDVTFLDSRTYAVQFSNWKRVSCFNTKVNQHTALSSYSSNQDGIHFNGPGQFGVVDGIHANCNDDAVALNADDGTLSSTFDNWSHGAITDVSIKDVFLDNSQAQGNRGIRLLSGASRIDRITISGVYGATRFHAIIIDNLSDDPSNLTLAGAGNFGTIKIDSIQCDLIEYGEGTVFLSAKIDDIEISGSISNPTAVKPFICLGANADIRSIRTRLAQSGAQETPSFLTSAGALFNWDAHVDIYAGTSDISCPVFSITAPTSGCMLRVTNSSVVSTTGIIGMLTSGALTVVLDNINYLSNLASAAIIAGAGSSISVATGATTLNGADLSSGNVTISNSVAHGMRLALGTTAPVSQFHMKGDARDSATPPAGAQVTVEDTQPSGKAYVWGSGTGGAGSFGIYDLTDSAMRFRVNSSGVIQFPAGYGEGLAAFDISGNISSTSLGTSLSMSGGLINTIQDIRTSAGPQFTQLKLGNSSLGRANVCLIKGPNKTQASTLANFIVATDDAQSADIGGSIGLGGDVGGGDNIPFAWLSGRKDNSLSGNYAGYFAISLNDAGGGVTEKLRITSSGSLILSSIVRATSNAGLSSGTVWCDTSDGNRLKLV